MSTFKLTPRRVYNANVKALANDAMFAQFLDALAELLDGVMLRPWGGNMTEEEMQGHVRQLEQLAQRRDAAAFVVLGLWCDGWRLAIHWNAQPASTFFSRTADGAFRLAEQSFGYESWSRQ